MSESNEMTLIASKGTLDWAYPPLILASTGIAMGKEVSVFCTFYGLNLLLKDLNMAFETKLFMFFTKCYSWFRVICNLNDEKNHEE
jgi:peroxiredoxin family protein